MTYDEQRALDLAKECGWRVQPDGYVLAPRQDQSQKDMLIAFYRKAQWDLMDDGK